MDVALVTVELASIRAPHRHPTPTRGACYPRGYTWMTAALVAFGLFFSWKDDPRSGDGRTAIWLHPAMSLRFKYAGSIPVDLNRAWLEALATSADSTHGLVLVPEPGPHA